MQFGSQQAGDDVKPLLLKREICETSENITANIDRTLATSYVRFNEFLDSQSGPVSIVGAGPSLVRTYKNIEGDVFACNGAHDFLIEHGVIPRFTLLFDAAPFLGDFITPHKEVIYLVASRCHENVFKKLDGFKVVVWHCKGDEGLEEKLAEKRLMEPMIHGGSAAVVRAIFMVFAMGYRQIHLYGADSSFEGDVHHAGKSLVPEKVLEIWAGRWFNTTAWMAGQVEDFRDFALTLEKLGAKFIVHGTGLLPCMAQAIGLEVRGDGMPQVAPDIEAAHSTT